MKKVDSLLARLNIKQLKPVLKYEKNLNNLRMFVVLIPSEIHF